MCLPFFGLWVAEQWPAWLTVSAERHSPRLQLELLDYCRTQSVTTLTVVFAFNSSVLLRRDLRLSRLIFNYLTIIWNFSTPGSCCLAFKILIWFFSKKNPKPWCTTCCAASVLWHHTISSDKLQHCWSVITIRVIALQLSHIVNKNKTQCCAQFAEKSQKCI